jgi:hypothetical protein
VDHVLRLALIGTGKRTDPPEATDHPADQLVADCRVDLVEQNLLLQAGTWATYQLAGYVPENVTKLPEPASQENSPPCSNRAGQIFLEFVGRNQPDLVAEASQQLFESNQRLPPAILPDVLEKCGSHESPFLPKAMGKRGLWLSQFNEKWQKTFAASEVAGKESQAEVEKIWTEGTLGLRKAALSKVRQTDPDLGRQWLEAAWQQEKADTRAELLETLAATLGPGDVAFLEQIMSDSSKRVRSTAAHYLCLFPDSELTKRMRALAESMLNFTPAKVTGRLKSLVRSVTGAKADPGKLVITPPKDFDKEWEKDGIQEKPPAGVGKREYWMAQVLECVSPTHWEEHFQASPDQLILAAQGDDFGRAFIEAWSKAAVFFKCLSWMAPLWDSWFDQEPKKEQPKDRDRTLHWLKELLKTMPAADREPRALRLLEQSTPDKEEALSHVLAMLPHPWSPAIARSYLNRIREMASVATKDQGFYGWVATLPSAAQAVPQSCFAEALSPWAITESEDYTGRAWQKAVNEFLETVQLRNEFHALVSSKE